MFSNGCGHGFEVKIPIRCFNFTGQSFSKFFAMKNLIKFLFILLLPVLVFTNCKEDSTEPTTSEFDLMTQYMAANDLDLSDVLTGWVVSATGVNVNTTDYSVPDYFVIDLRAQADFDAGHIKDAHIATMATLLDVAAQANGKKILVTCYTGQTAARATAALRLMKYEAYTLKWGMSGWHDDLAGKWKSNATDFASPNWVTNGTPTVLGEFNMPTFATGQTEGGAILRERVKAMLQKEWTLGKDVLLADPGSYFVNNYWPQVSWDAFGHVNGAYRIYDELNLSGLKYLDPSKTIVTYCYTGQTSAIVTGWLDVLGYNGRSLMYGGNGIVYSQLKGSDVDGGKKKSWHGEGAGSECNFGYYNGNGDMIGPK